MDIGGVHIESKLALAPMAGVTDLAFRTICREAGAGYTYTEMVSAKALCFQDQKTLQIMELGEGEHPSAVQIFGSDVDCMARAAEKVARIADPDVIDINMGCPVPKVAAHGDGSGLLQGKSIDPRTDGRKGHGFASILCRQLKAAFVTAF